MSINRTLADNANAAPIWQEAIRAQFKFLYGEIAHYMTAGKRMEDLVTFGTAELMPHQWGSIDSYDDMRSTLTLASELFDQALDAPADEEKQREKLRELLDGLNPEGIAPEVRELAFAGWDEAHIQAFFDGDV
jgi:hypothetical protein